jgi:hypothetical protein
MHPLQKPLYTVNDPGCRQQDIFFWGGGGNFLLFIIKKLYKKSKNSFIKGKNPSSGQLPLVAPSSWDHP